MSLPDIKLRKISLLNFRGSKDPLELDFTSKHKSCAIFGYNGEGKSTFTQAFEWFLMNRISALSGEGISDEDILNLASSEGDETSVTLLFNKSKLNSSKIYDKAKRRHKYTNSTTDFIDYIENKSRYDRLYLDQNTIMWFLAQSKGKKKEEIAKIVGYEEIVKIKSVISSASRELERNPRLNELQKNIANNQGLMTSEVYGEAVNDIKGLIQKSQQLLKVFNYKEPIGNLEDLNKTIEKIIQFLPSEERTRERVSLENLKTSISSLQKISDISTDVNRFVKDYNKLVKDQKKVAKLNLDEFLRQGEKVLKDDLSVKICPLCERPIKNAEGLLKKIVNRYKKLIELRDKLDQFEQDLSELEVNIQNLKANWSDVLDEIKKHKINIGTINIQNYVKLIDKIQSVLNNNFKTRKNINLNKKDIKSSLNNLNNTITIIYKQLDKLISSLAITDDEKKKQIAFSKLTRGRDLVLANIGYSKEIKAFKIITKDIKTIEAQLLDIQNNTLEQVLNSISKDVNYFFNYLNKRSDIKNVKLEIKGEEGIEFSLEFYDNEASPPKKYLSESQLNSLGISFFLAAVKKFNKSNKFFILDDVLVSFDRNYRLRLLDLLSEHFSDYQVLLLTHEEYWFQMIKRKFPEWVFKEVSWSFKSGIRFKDDEKGELENIRKRHRNGENVGNDLRIYIESLLKYICNSLGVKLEARFGPENDRRMAGELFNELTHTIKKHNSKINESKEYKDLFVSNFIVTISSHDNPDYSSIGDIEGVIDKVNKFKSLFICPKGNIISKGNVIPGKNKIACKCGCIDMEWK